MSAPEIMGKLEPLDWSTEEVSRFLADRQSDIWSEAGPQISAYNDAEKNVATCEAGSKAIAEAKPGIVRFYEDYLPAAFGLLIMFAFFAGLVSLFSATARYWFAAFFRLPNLGLFISLMVALGLALGVIRIIARRIFRNYTTSLAESASVLTSARSEKERLSTLIEPAVVTSITGHLREFIDQKATPAFSLELPETDTSRLSEVPDPHFDVITDSRRQVRGLVDRMNGGSLGVAGPRGCGKTTLLRSFCPEGNVNPRELTVFASAPVQYDPREFLLQLFTSICSQVLSKETKTETQSTWTEMDSLRSSASPALLTAETIASMLLLMAFFLITAGLALGSVRVVADRYHPPKPPPAAAVATAPAAAAASGTASSGAGVAAREPALWVFLDSNGFPYLVWGLISLFLGSLMQSTAGRSRYRRILGFYSRALPTALRPSTPEATLNVRAASVEGLSPEAKALIDRATRTLRGLRFQQSYSSGWSGSLKLPVGLEGGATTAMTLAERQLGLPEIVEEYRAFVRSAALYYDRVFVAIDEMDKLPTDEDAKKFLNGIKAIFGQEKVYYLVSISENALSNFERRGLPIRDEFDSSFDDAVHLGYFNLPSSRRLLARRSSVPPPAPYRAFCHVVSGVLPRDLIRSCRKMYDYRRSLEKQALLADTCTQLLRNDIEAKLSAIRSTLQRIPDERGSVGVLTLMATCVWTPPLLEDVIYKLHHAQSALEESAKNASADVADNHIALASLVEELKAFLYFCLAAMITFASIDSEARYDKLDGTGVFEDLAIARQMLAVNRLAAIESLHRLVPLPLTSV